MPRQSTTGQACASNRLIGPLTGADFEVASLSENTSAPASPRERQLGEGTGVDLLGMPAQALARVDVEPGHAAIAAAVQLQDRTPARNLSRASQPAVSKAMRELERQLDVCLFERHANGVVPTDDATPSGDVPR